MSHNVTFPLKLPMFVQSPAIWLIPFAQLKATARAAWTEGFGHQPMPQIMTLREWAGNLGALQKRRDDLSFDVAIDRIKALEFLQVVEKSTGQRVEPTHVQRLLDAAYELSGIAAAMPPSARGAWMRQHANLFQSSVFQFEGVIQFLALNWAGDSRYDTDVLWERENELVQSTEHFYVSTGLQSDDFLKRLLINAQDKTTTIELGVLTDASDPLQAISAIRVISAIDAEDLVQQTVACILGSQQKRIALITLDRQITRRVSAALLNKGVSMTDDAGWTLSTTTAAMRLLAWLSTLSPDAKVVHSDVVLAALKTAPLAFAPKDVMAFEALIRRKGWTCFPMQLDSDIASNIKKRHSDWQAPRTLSQWLAATQALLKSLQLWDDLVADEAGQTVLAALHMGSDAAVAEIATTLGVSQKMTREAYSQWVRAVLEANHFKPAHVSDAPSTQQVTVLPLAQLWGRSFDAIIVPGCDAARLPARPHAQGDWSRAEREALNLATPETALAAHLKAWDWLCAQPQVMLLWHESEGSEALQKSVFLQRLEMQGRLEMTSLDSRLRGNDGDGGNDGVCADVFNDGVVIDWQHLAPAHISASSYADLRACPYRFYASRVLGLASHDELDAAIEKRDFGTWLHGVLYRFHEAFKLNPSADQSSLLDAAAQDEQIAQGLDAAAFLPFSLIWPETREAYLAWLASHTADGFNYFSGEVSKNLPLDIEGQSLKLVGKLDRVDTYQTSGVNGAKGLLLIDYKTESENKTRQRISKADEDTQLAFYAALVKMNESEDAGEVVIQAAYVNLAERLSEVKLNKDGKHQQTKFLEDVIPRSEALLDGIWSDLSRVAKGHGLRALGEGAACEHCHARGLCRKDFV